MMAACRTKIQQWQFPCQPVTIQAQLDELRSRFALQNEVARAGLHVAVLTEKVASLEAELAETKKSCGITLEQLAKRLVENVRDENGLPQRDPAKLRRMSNDLQLETLAR
jgi:hypothetical protein